MSCRPTPHPLCPAVPRQSLHSLSGGYACRCWRSRSSCRCSCVGYARRCWCHRSPCTFLLCRLSGAPSCGTRRLSSAERRRSRGGPAMERACAAPQACPCAHCRGAEFVCLTKRDVSFFCAAATPSATPTPSTATASARTPRTKTTTLTTKQLGGAFCALAAAAGCRARHAGNNARALSRSGAYLFWWDSGLGLK